MGKRKQLVAPAAPPKAEGKGKKRTPQSEFDPAAGKDIYEPDKIIAQRMVKGGVTQYQVKWVGWESKAEEYLANEEVFDLNTPVLAWWHRA